MGSLGWIDRARAALEKTKQDRGWGYARHLAPAVEPTALACLGLLSTDDSEGQRSRDLVRSAAAWVAGLQQPDGSVGPAANLPAPGWPTPLAFLLWRAAGGQAVSCGRAVTWLLGRKGKVFPRTPDLPLKHDTTIQGWPWASDTHPWVEPTAMAMLALRRAGRGACERAREGRRLLLDRAVPSGGWNYGNTVIFGTPLLPQPGPTGLALLALAGEDRSAAVSGGLRYLEAALPTMRSGPSLCWGILGLEAWGRRPAEADTWLARAFAEASARVDLPHQAALALLGAGGRRALRLLGVDAEAEG